MPHPIIERTRRYVTDLQVLGLGSWVLGLGSRVLDGVGHGFAGFRSRICGGVGFGYWMPKLRVVESRILEVEER